MLDTCYSERGGNEITAAALTRFTHHWERAGCGLVVFTSTEQAGQAQTGAFPYLLRRAVRSPHTAGRVPQTLAVDALLTAMNRHPERPKFQTISLSMARLTDGVPPFFPNPRHDPELSDDHILELEVQSERRAVEYRTRLLPHAMASHGPTGGWWFSGRHAALTEITSWLTNPDPARPLLAVTAGPGSGKTAVLGMIATLSDPDHRAKAAVCLPAAAIPPEDVIDVAIYAQRLTTDQVLDGIAAAEAMSEHAEPLTVLVDALDEASDPDKLSRRLHLFAKRGRVRLLVGTRPHLLKTLKLTRDVSIDLDAPRYADPDALIDYAARCLREAVADSPYQRQPHRVPDIARAVAEAASPSFLVARIVSITLAAGDTIPDPRDPSWRRTLPRLPGDAMRSDLETRLGQEAGKVRDMLRPLAFAEGQGLPWEDIWASVASAMAGVTYTDDDLEWLRGHAGSYYVVEVAEADRSAYRLYHHALAEHLREGTDKAAIHQAFTRVLRSRVPVNLDGSPDWSRAHPYVLRHLATHAARCGLLDDLITDTDYLTHAQPDELLTALHAVTTAEGRLTRSIYRASIAAHRHLSPLRRRQVLAIDAARFAATRQHRALAETLEWQPRWATGQQTSPALHTTLTGHEPQEIVYTVSCTTVDGRPVAVTVSYDQTMRVWDLTSGTPRATLRHEHWVMAVACGIANGQPVAVSADHSGTVLVWDLKHGTLRTTLTEGGETVNAVACTSIDNCPVVLTAGRDRWVQVWDLASGWLRTTLPAHESWVTAVACTTLDHRPVAVTIGYDQTVRIFDLVTAAEVSAINYPGPGGVTRSASDLRKKSS